MRLESDECGERGGTALMFRHLKGTLKQSRCKHRDTAAALHLARLMCAEMSNNFVMGLVEAQTDEDRIRCTKCNKKEEFV
jgi:hypothetical protein